MKRVRKMVAIVVALAVMVSSVTVFRGTVSKAADYSSSPTLAFNGSWGAEKFLTETNNEHWYKVVISSDGVWNARIMSYISEDYIRWKLYNDDLSEVLRSGDTGYGSETSPDTISNNIVLSAGTYYYRIYSNNGRSGKYKLYDKFTPYGVNDKAAVSYDSPLKYTMGTTITGAITETDSEDWYKITVPSDGYYIQKIVSYFDEGFLRWELFNWDLSDRLANGSTYYASEAAPDTIKDDFVLSKGTYYVKITSSYRAGKYLFQFSKLTKKNCSHDYDSTWHNATYFKKGYRKYQCEKCGHSYKGDYEPVLKLGQGYLYTYCSTGKGKMHLYWSTVSDASGYQIRYSKQKKWKSGVLVKTVKGRSKDKKTISKLSRKKKYYVQVRAYKKSGSKTVYGKWSGKRCLKTK